MTPFLTIFFMLLWMLTVPVSHAVLHIRLSRIERRQDILYRLLLAWLVTSGADTAHVKARLAKALRVSVEQLNDPEFLERHP